MAEAAVPARSFPNFEKLLRGHKALVHWHPQQAEHNHSLVVFINIQFLSSLS